VSAGFTESNCPSSVIGNQPYNSSIVSSKFYVLPHLEIFYIDLIGLNHHLVCSHYRLVGIVVSSSPKVAYHSLELNKGKPGTNS
jgi:hypothetical protein